MLILVLSKELFKDKEYQDSVKFFSTWLDHMKTFNYAKLLKTFCVVTTVLDLSTPTKAGLFYLQVNNENDVDSDYDLIDNI